MAQTPQIGSLYPLANSRLQGLRKWKVKGFDKYLIFYLIEDDLLWKKSSIGETTYTHAIFIMGNQSDMALGGKGESLIHRNIMGWVVRSPYTVNMKINILSGNAPLYIGRGGSAIALKVEILIYHIQHENQSKTKSSYFPLLCQQHANPNQF